MHYIPHYSQADSIVPVHYIVHYKVHYIVHYTAHYAQADSIVPVPAVADYLRRHSSASLTLSVPPCNRPCNPPCDRRRRRLRPWVLGAATGGTEGCNRRQRMGSGGCGRWRRPQLCVCQVLPGASHGEFLSNAAWSDHVLGVVRGVH